MMVRSIVGVVLMLVGAACSGDMETPTSATATATGPTTILFSGTLQPRTSRFYSYTVATAGSVSAMLASVERNGAPLAEALELSLGSPAGTGCAVTMSAHASASLVPQLRHDAAAGTYCVRVADTEGLPAPAAFTIRVIHP
ncbi:MAG: hypothetical protein Q8O42_23465 [Acidobacteriota bacterium]|nr:hypothetical protein [Acidobacteriota bacterium]